MDNKILLGHGSGGLLSHELISELFAKHFSNPFLDDMGDAAVIDSLPPGRLAMSTDSYVVQPLFFPGGNIGELAICGTVNDLAVAGAKPLYLSAGFILEEGLDYEILEKVVISMAETAREAGVMIITGDTKVVDKGAADGLFINTAGVGVVPPGVDLHPNKVQVGDKLIVSGSMGDHGLAVMMRREGMDFSSALQSDTAPLNGMIAQLLDAVPGQVRCMRDATRGGLATVLNEWASPRIGIEIEESKIPVKEQVRAACEFLGLDAFYAANEGKIVIAVAPEAAEQAVAALKAHRYGVDAAIIGSVTEAHAGRVVLRTPYGARRILQMLTGAQLPRIC